MARYVWTAASVRDLNDIYDYVAVRSVAAADRLMDEFDRKADLYAGNPLLGEAWPGLGADVRAFRVARYVVPFRPIPEGIRLLRIFHTARDIPGT